MEPYAIKTVKFYNFYKKLTFLTATSFLHKSQEKTLTFGEELDEDKLQFYSDKHFLKEPFYS